MGSTPVVLIARLDDNKALYAVEYESKGLYVLFKLGSWVDLGKLCSVAVVSRPYTKSYKHDNPQDVAGRGTSANNAFSPPESDKYNKKKRLAIEAIQSMVKRPSTSQSLNIEQTASTEALSAALPPEPIQDAQLDPVASVQPLQDAVLEQPRAEDILDSVRSQYLDTLYLSKVSTAYFAKGPLSRARAAFHLDLDSTLHMKDLTQFLDSLVLPTNILDKKYKDGLQEFVSTLDPGNESDLDADMKTRPRKRKSKKVKLGKNGLYNTEDSFIKSWWENHDADTETPGAAKEDTSRNRISKLRVREILLQIILILETLALQKLSPPPDPNDDLPLPAMTEAASGDKIARNKAKKPRDLPALVAVHLDRLSIWSLSAGEGTSTSKPGTSNVANLSAAGGSDATDILRNFCLEVVVPFFSARLPSLCDTICRKLGGPRVSSPARPPLKKSSSMSTAPSRPSAVSKRVASTESRRSLQRALTDEKLQARSRSRRPSVAVSLLRSATAPVLPPGLKREGSEAASLSSIPTMNSQSQHATRTAVQKSRKISQTENDMSLGNLPDRNSKKASIEAELKYAISALKKPNRQLAGQTTVELAEKRAIAGASQSRKAKKPTRNPGFENMRPSGVQILATPKKPRNQNMGPDSQLFPERQAQPELGPSFVPPSSISRIPSSGQRLAIPDSSPPLYRTAPMSREQHQLSVVNATPTRASRQSKLEYNVSVVDTTPVRGSSAYYGTMGAANQTAAVADTPVRTSRASDDSKYAFVAPKPRRVEIPPSPSPPRARRISTIDNFLRVPPEPHMENISETPRKSAPILCTPVKTRTEPQNEAVRPRSPLKPLNFSAAFSRFEEGSNLLESKAIKPAAADDGDIYKSLGWDDDDL